MLLFTLAESAQTLSQYWKTLIEQLQVHYPWLLGLLTLLGSIILFAKEWGAIALDLGDKTAGILGYLNIQIPHRRQKADDSKLDKIRQLLLKSTQQDVESRLRQALHNNIQIPLYLESQHQQVGQEQPPLIQAKPELTLNRMLAYVDNKIRPGRELKPQETLFDVFQEFQERLLILGEPGSGKTTELLILAQHLVQQAETDESAPVPVILELSNWNGQPIIDWIVKQISKREYFRWPDKLLRQGIVDGQILWLLDGLDELGPAQDDCIQAINKLIECASLLQLVVCCRLKNYQGSGPLQLDQLNGAVQIEPLRDQQIRDYCQQLNCLYQWEHVKRDPALLTLARKPLFLHMLVTTAQKMPIRNQTELFDTYIEKKFNDTERQFNQLGKKFTSRKQTRRYLIWLARQLERTGETEFYIENLQPTWLFPNEIKLFYIHKTVVSLISLPFTLILSSIILDQMLDLTVSFEDRIGMAPHPIVVWSVSLIWAILLGFSTKEIKPVERLTFSPNSPSVIFVWSILGLVGGLLVEFFFRPVGEFLEIPLLASLILSSISGLLAGTVISLSGTVSAGMIPNENKRIPNEGIWRSLQNTRIVASWMGCLTGGFGGLGMGVLGMAHFDSLLVGIVGGVFAAVVFALFTALFVGLLYGILCGSFLAPMRHFVLRLVLFVSGKAPWNYKRFFEYAIQLRLIQNPGGRYRFVHTLLREHFAQMPMPQ